ncbi:hypothetical protein EMCRGX_G025011 [Ephydatia muelleri]
MGDCRIDSVRFQTKQSARVGQAEAITRQRASATSRANLNDSFVTFVVMIDFNVTVHCPLSTTQLECSS